MAELIEMPVTGERYDVLLWKYELEIKDLRDGRLLKASAIEIGNENYDLDAAAAKIEQKYATLGYKVLKCDFTSQRTFKFDAVMIYDDLPDDENGTAGARVFSDINTSFREDKKENVSSWGESERKLAEAAALRELKGAIE